MGKPGEKQGHWLQKWLHRPLEESIGLLQGELAKAAAAHASQAVLLEKTHSKAEDLSLQIEEIYDVVKENSLIIDAASTAKKREEKLITAIIGLSDMIDDFMRYADTVPELAAQAGAVGKKRESLLNACGIGRFDGVGEAFDGRFHSMHATEASVYPFKHVSRVMLNGFVYDGEIIRKATVMVSNNR